MKMAGGWIRGIPLAIVVTVAAQAVEETRPRSEVPQVEALQTAARIIIEQRNPQSEVARQAIRTAAPLFPQVPVSTEYGKVQFNKYMLNTRGIGLDGIRFKTPPEGPTYLLWAFACPSNLNPRWYIVPMTETKRDLHNNYEVLSSSKLKAPWPGDRLVIIQPLLELLPPENEYVFWLYFVNKKTGEVSKNPTEIYVGLYVREEGQFHFAKKKRIVAKRYLYPLTNAETVRDALGLLPDQPAPEDLLYGAIRAGDPTFIDYALSQGANINDIPALCYAVASADLDIIKYVVERGAEINRCLKPAEGENALHVLAFWWEKPMTKDERDAHAAKIAAYLVEAGVDINARTKDRKDTPLMLFIRSKHAITSLRLIELGADISLRDTYGKTALDMAREAKLDIIVKRLEAKP